MKPQVVKRLGALRQLDHDALHASARAIERIDVVAVRIAMDSFRRDHERHVFELSRVLVDDGEPIHDPHRRLRGVVREVVTALRAATGTRGALEAMRRTETMLHESIDRLLAGDLPPGARTLLEHHRDDDLRHLRYLELALHLLADDREGPTRWGRLSASSRSHG